MAETTRSGNRAMGWAHPAWVVGAFVVMAGLLSYQLGEREFWIDEQITTGHIRTAESVFDAFHPPGYYFMLRQWAGVFGDGDLALRAFSVPWALLALGFVWLIGRATLPRRAAILATWLCALSPFFLLYLRMARYFAPTMAVALGAAYFMLLCRRHGRWKHYVGLAICSAGLLWLHYVPSALLPLGYLWVLVGAWGRKGERVRWATAAAFPVVAYLPQILRALAGIGSVAHGSEGHAVSLKGIATKVVFAGYSVLIGETTDFWRLWIIAPVALAGVALWIVGARAVWKAREPRRWVLVLGWPLSVGLVVLLLSTVASSEPWPRVSSLAMFAAPLFYMMLARGADALPKWLGAALAGVFIAGQLYGTTNYLARRQFLNPGYNTPWREVQEIVQSEGEAGDLAIAVLDSTIYRYWDGPVRFHDGLAETGIIDEAARDDIAETLEAGRSVWVIARDRGSAVAKETSKELVEELGETAERPEVRLIGERSASEVRWRSKVQGAQAADAYLKVHRFRGG